MTKSTTFNVLVCLFFCSPLPAAAWEFSPAPICTLTHSTPDVDILLTYDQSIAEYALTLTLTAGEWLPSPTFGIGFKGGYQNTLGTSRHRIEGSSLRVADAGFGNVLDGLEFADRATAFTDRLAISIPLDGIAAPMQAFRACPNTAPATS